jgi:signal transduction histidine kinase/CheY-like chemotaxis protein
LKENTGAIRQKVIMAFFLATVSVVLYYSVTNIGFSNLLNSLDKLSQPNQKIEVLNEIFSDILRIDQYQRELTVEMQKNGRSTLFTKSASLNGQISKLRDLVSEDCEQQMKIDSLEYFLEQRDILYIRYSISRRDLVQNKDFNEQMDSLMEIISSNKIDIDTMIDAVTTHTKTTTTSIQPFDTILISRTEVRPTGFFKKIFGGKKVEQDTIYEEYLILNQQIEEYYETKIDSIKTIQSDSLTLMSIENKVLALKTEQLIRLNNLVRNELNYVTASNELIDYVLVLIQDLELDEIHRIEEAKDHALSLSGQSILLAKSILIIFLTGGSLLAYLILTDIGRSQKYRRELEEAKKESERLQKSKERFLANVSHEIKTPLQSIIGFSEQLKHEKEANQDSLTSIIESSQQLKSLINEYLDYSRITSDKFTLQPSHFNLSDLVHYTNNNFLDAAKQKDLKIEVKTDEGIGNLAILADGYRLKQIISNLVSNAIKYTDTGFISICFSAKEESDSEVSLDIIVKDSGVGIPEAEQKNIFDFFERGNINDDLYKGTGIGLSIVKDLVSIMNGTIQLNSQPGEGSEFTVSLLMPLSKLSSSLEQPTEGIGEFSQYKLCCPVYILDDDLSILKYLEWVFSLLEADTFTFDDPDELFNSLPEGKDILVITDIRMKKMSGYKVMEKIKANSAIKAKILAMTAQVMELEHGDVILCEGLLYKPFTISNIKEVLESVGLISKETRIENQYLDQFSVYDDDLLAIIETENLKDIASIKKAISMNEYHKLSDMLHKLASRIGMQNSEHFYKDLRKLEIKLKNKPNDERAIAELLEVIRKIEITPASVLV